MKNNRIISLITAIPMCFTASLNNTVSFKAEAESIKYEYGVFLGADPEESTDCLDEMTSYKKIVLDAQCFSEEQIKSLQDSGHTVYSYINIGSLEEYRDYVDEYTRFALGEYINWDDEVWIDVSQKEWQDFIVNDLAKEILDKGVDGLWVDNCDVYYNYTTNDIYNGLTEILKGLKKYDTYVVINGGDTYVSRYARKNKSLDAVMDAVNQESVFSSIDWGNDNKFIISSDEDRGYFQDYCDLVSSYGKDVYLLEYTKNDGIIDSVKDYCAEKGYTYYASDTLDLLTPGQKKGSQPLVEKAPENVDDTDIPAFPGSANYADSFRPGIWEYIENGDYLGFYMYIDPNGKDFTFINPENDMMMKGKYSLKDGAFKMKFNDGPVTEGTVTIWEDRAVFEADDIINIMTYCSDSTPETFEFLNNEEIIKHISDYYAAVMGKALTPDDIYIVDNSFYAEVYLSESSDDALCYINRLTGDCLDSEGVEIDLKKYSADQEASASNGANTEEAKFTVEDAENFTCFLHGKKVDLKGKNFDLNNDGMWNAFDLIELRKLVSKG